MKSFNNFLGEVAQPKGKDEKAFKNAHAVKLMDQEGNDNQFTANTYKKPRIADNSMGSDVSSYESMPGQRKVDQPTITPTDKVVVINKEVPSISDILGNALNVAQRSLRPFSGPVNMFGEEVDYINEKLKPSMGAAAYIDDFVHSKDPKFAGKNKKQRIKQALAAYYAAKKNESVEDLEERNDENKARKNDWLKSKANDLSDKKTMMSDKDKNKHGENLNKRLARKSLKVEATDWDPETRAEKEVSHWDIIHKPTGKVVGKASTKKTARSSVDKHDNKYGGYAHYAKPVWKESVEENLEEANKGTLHMYHTMSKRGGDVKHIHTEVPFHQNDVLHPEAIKKIKNEDPVLNKLRAMGYANEKTHAIWHGDVNDEIQNVENRLSKPNTAVSPLSISDDKKRLEALKKHKDLLDTNGHTTMDDLADENDLDEAAYSAKAARAGKDIGKPGKNFEKIAKKAEKEYGSKEAGKRVAGAILAKIRAKHMHEEMDPVGKEDEDVNNDGKVDKTDEYILKRRAAISKAINDKKDASKEEKVLKKIKNDKVDKE